VFTVSLQIENKTGTVLQNNQRARAGRTGPACWLFFVFRAGVLGRAGPNTAEAGFSYLKCFINFYLFE
jgi:hypothetical protein